MTESLRVLLAEIVDYAGLFPPSKVGMTSAVQNYADYLEGEYAWMLGRFILPVSRLDEFAAEAENLFGEKTWLLSVIADRSLPETLAKIDEFNEQHSEKAKIDTLEIKVDSAEEIHAAEKILPKTLTTYFEIPLKDVLTDLMMALAITHNRAKFRTGGITQDAFPNSADVIRFMRICIAANVPFKATAGLHHPLRCIKPLTYESNSVNGTMHGFLSLFMSAVFLRQNLNHSFVHELINETKTETFRFEDERLNWKEHSVENFEVELGRKRSAISFGSCSFNEPIEDLKELGFL